MLLFVNIYNDCIHISHQQNLLMITCLIIIIIIYCTVSYSF
jgi:hypothetical protein